MPCTTLKRNVYSNRARLIRRSTLPSKLKSLIKTLYECQHSNFRCSPISKYHPQHFVRSPTHGGRGAQGSLSIPVPARPAAAWGQVFGRRKRATVIAFLLSRATADAGAGG